MKNIYVLFLVVLFSSCTTYKKTISSYSNEKQIVYNGISVCNVDSKALLNKFNASPTDYSIFMDFTKKKCKNIPVKMEKIKKMMTNSMYKSELVIVFSENRRSLESIYNEYVKYSECDLPKKVYYLDIRKYKGNSNQNMRQLLEELNLNPLYIEGFYVYDNRNKKFINKDEFK